MTALFYAQYDSEGRGHAVVSDTDPAVRAPNLVRAQG